MSKLTTLVALAVLALLIPTAAVGKGPREGTVSGPGLDGPIQLTGLGEPASSGTLGRVVEHGGLFAALGGSEWGTLLAEQPNGDLGPRYTATFVMRDRAARTVRQHLYPYAQPSPVTFTPRGQKPFGTAEMGGGWFVADERLKAALVEAGLPATAPATPSDGTLDVPGPLIAAAGAALLALAAAALLARRRAQAATR